MSKIIEETIAELFHKIDSLVSDTHSIKIQHEKLLSSLALQNQTLVSLIAGAQKELSEVKKKSHQNAERLLLLEQSSIRAETWVQAINKIAQIFWACIGAGVLAFASWLLSLFYRGQS